MDKTFARRDALAGPRPAPPRRSASPQLPLQRQGQPGGHREGRRVSFASDAADWVTGQTMNVDGGQVMNDALGGELGTSSAAVRSVAGSRRSAAW